MSARIARPGSAGRAARPGPRAAATAREPRRTWLLAPGRLPAFFDWRTHRRAERTRIARCANGPTRKTDSRRHRKPGPWDRPDADASIPRRFDGRSRTADRTSAEIQCRAVWAAV